MDALNGIMTLLDGVWSFMCSIEILPGISIVTITMSIIVLIIVLSIFNKK